LWSYGSRVLGAARRIPRGRRSAGAQQYVVDDAEIVDLNACHVEAWHGQRSSWILPACQLIPNLEIAAGVGFIEEGLGHRETEYAVEAKTLLRPLTPGDWGVGLVLGVGKTTRGRRRTSTSSPGAFAQIWD
jgi:hypothetical protein